jgi:beta-lactam-binding protein with PASTA domain
MRLIARNLKELALQVIIFLILTAGGVLFFFYIYLPSETNHGETITVPDLKGVTYDELDRFLTERNLRYFITEDSGYSDQYPPKAVLQQNPLPGDKVKENRKIYLTLNRVSPPTTRMPCLVNGSIKNAQAVLKSYGLKLGSIKYKPALGVNSVLEQWYGGRQYFCDSLEKQKILIPKGSRINLVAADGLGKKRFPVPNLVGKKLDEAEFTLIGSGLNVGAVIFQPLEIIEVVPDDSASIEVEIKTYELGEVVKQNPAYEDSIRVGQTVDLWVAGTEEEYEAKIFADSVSEAENYGEFE